MTSVMIYVLEKLCLSGNVLSGIIAFNIWRIPEKTLVNKMFLVNFAIDCVIGATDPYFLFKLFRERSGLMLLDFCDLVIKHHFKLLSLSILTELDIWLSKSKLVRSVTSVTSSLLDTMTNSNRNKTVNYFWLLGCFGTCREESTTLQWWE